MSLETFVFLAGNLAEAAVVGLLLYRRAWRTLPVFCIYSIETLIGSIVYFVVQHCCSSQAYFNTYFCENILDAALQFCVLVEIAWSVVRPYRKSLPRKTVWVLGVLIAATGAAIWPFAAVSAFAHFPVEWQMMARLLQTVSILRVLFFLVLAGCSHFLSIGWRDRELQIATGLGFYSLASLAATVLHSHQAAGPQYRMVDHAVEATYLCSLLYWAFSFAQQEAKRREFTPQMQGLLLAMAGAARSTRVGLSDSASAKERKRGE